MHYVDLLFSLVLFVLGVLSFIFKRFRKNFWISVIALLFFPISVFSVYFREYEVVIFGNITLLDIVQYPLLKILIILSYLSFSVRERKHP